MAKRTTDKKLLQWHPAFYAGLQIEFAEEAGKLTFENEHQLSKKPMEIDVLIIKKDTETQIKKNIGRIFRKYNIFEYKSPEDYLSIDDFYKVYGYACFYKSDTPKTDSIKSNEITLSFVCGRSPEKLLKHLCTERQMDIIKPEDGIYYIKGAYFPIQLILTSELSRESNLWLRNLTNNMKEKEDARNLLAEYCKHRSDGMYEAVMNIISRANSKLFEEDEEMCEAFWEFKNVQAKVEEVKKETRAEERALAIKDTLLGLLREGLLSAADVAVRLNVTEAEVQKMLDH